MAHLTSMELLFKEFKILSENMRKAGDETSVNLIDFLCERKDAAIIAEREQRIKDYNAGYDDAQCNHINDAENYVNESKY